MTIIIDVWLIEVPALKLFLEKWTIIPKIVNFILNLISLSQLALHSILLAFPRSLTINNGESLKPLTPEKRKYDNHEFKYLKELGGQPDRELLFFIGNIYVTANAMVKLWAGVHTGGVTWHVWHCAWHHDTARETVRLTRDNNSVTEVAIAPALSAVSSSPESQKIVEQQREATTSHHKQSGITVTKQDGHSLSRSVRKNMSPETK